MLQSRTFKAAILGSGQFLVTLTGLISTAILARVFTKTDYAAYRQTLLTYTFLAPLLQLGLPQALYYFLPQDEKEGRRILTGNLVLLSLAGCFFAIVMWCGGNVLLAERFSNPALRQLLLIYSPYALFTLPAAAIGAVLVSRGQVKTLTTYNVSSRIVTAICVIGLAIVWQTSSAAVLGNVIAAVLAFFPALFLMYRANPGKDWYPTAANMWEQIKYSVPLGLAGIIGTMTIQLDNLVVASMCTPEEFAIYANGAIEIPLIQVITGSVTSVLIPEFVQLYKNSDYEQVRLIWSRAIVRTSLLILPMFVFLLLSAPLVIRLLYSRAYEASVIPFRIYLMILPTRVATYGTLFMCTGNNRLILVRSAITLLLDFLVAVVMVHLIGYIGAAISAVAVFYLWALPFNLYHFRRFLRTSVSKVMPFIEMARIFLVCLLCASIFLLRYWTDNLPDILNLLVLGSIYSVLYLGLIWCIKDFRSYLTFAPFLK